MKKLNFKLLALQGMILTALISGQSLSALNVDSNVTILAGGGCPGKGGCPGGGGNSPKRIISMNDDSMKDAQDNAKNANDQMKSTTDRTMNQMDNKNNTNQTQDTTIPQTNPYNTNKGKIMQNDTPAPRGSGCPGHSQLLGKDSTSVMAEKRDALV